jgi:hypothetical protein
MEQTRFKGESLEAIMKKRRVVDLSLEERSTLIAAAGRDAVQRARDAGLPLTGSRNGKIIKTYPDGREEVLKVLQQELKEEKAAS